LKQAIYQHFSRDANNGRYNSFFNDIFSAKLFIHIFAMPIRSYLTRIMLILLLFLPGCGRDQPEETAVQAGPGSPAVTTPGCRSCHPFELKGKHAELNCTTCHDGDDQTANPSLAHAGMTAHPAHPDNMEAKCGPCHSQTSTAPMASHFTIKNKVNLVRRHFGADHDLASLKEIPVIDEPSSPLELADDLLRRRCLRCHLYYQGDEYSLVRRGTGCGACHLEYQDGKLLSHQFLAAPTDRQCLSCHYGNRVGSDYYGRFDHDFKGEYRTPYRPDGSYPSRPYGIEQHQLSPDVHQQAGMICRDCHPGMHSSRTMTTISCEGCHLAKADQPLPGKHLSIRSGQLTMMSLGKAGQIIVPALKHPVHTQKNGVAACAVCHARWTFNDQNTHLLRIDSTDYEEWDDLYVQDSSEVEELLLNGIYGDEELEPLMRDKISGETRPGMWLKGFRTRRWETPVIKADERGRLQIMRPVLDLNISWLDEQGETGFDSIKGLDNEMRPYTPHTIGKAGTFYQQRLSETPARNTTHKAP
jgi:hypothetical protein